MAIERTFPEVFNHHKTSVFSLIWRQKKTDLFLFVCFFLALVKILNYAIRMFVWERGEGEWDRERGREGGREEEGIYIFNFIMSTKLPKWNLLSRYSSRLTKFCFRCCGPARNLRRKVYTPSSKAALLRSFTIFTARKEPSWQNPNPLIEVIVT